MPVPRANVRPVDGLDVDGLMKICMSLGALVPGALAPDALVPDTPEGRLPGAGRGT